MVGNVNQPTVGPEQKNRRVYTFAVETGLAGAESRHVRMAKMLVALGYDLSWYGTGHRSTELERHGVKYETVRAKAGASGRVLFAFSLARLHLHRGAIAFAFNPDVFIGIALSRLIGRRAILIYFCRNDLVYQNAKLNEHFGLKLPIRRHVLRQLACYLMADRYAVQSDFARTALERRFSFVPRRLRPEIFVLPNDLHAKDLGHEIEADRAQREGGGTDAKHFEYAFIANPAWHKKGFDVLAATIRVHFRAESNRRIHIIGAGDAFEKLIRRVEASENVVFHGYTSDVLSLLASIDTLFAPTVVDHFPNVILEAVTARKPVLCTRIDAHENILGQDHLLYFETNSSVAEIGRRLLMSEDIDFRSRVIENQLSAIEKFDHAWKQGLPRVFK